MKKYDFTFSIGRACACSQSLRRAGLQLLSLPWDWVALNPKPEGPDLHIRLHIMESGFSDWLQEDDLRFAGTKAENGKDQYRNERYSIVYPHDFPHGVPLHESYPAVKAKYDRRVNRFKRLMADSKGSVLAVYMDTPVSPKADVETCRDAQRRIQAMYPHVKVDFLMISLESGRSFEERTIEELGDGFTRISFDFKDYRPDKPDFSVNIEQCAAAMQSVASVKDYRTSAEKKAMDERTRKVKLREYGAENNWQYFLIRRKRELDRIREILFPRVAIARLRQKKYDHVLSLGMNCEPAFRFSLLWGFVDSTPFAWALYSRLNNMQKAIRNPGLIGSDGFEWNADTMMWRCRRTRGSFHGRLTPEQCSANPDSDVMDADRKDLEQRIKHLEEKFTRIISDESSKAIIFRLHTYEAQSEEANTAINDIQHALEERGARNYTLVVVTENAVRGRIRPAPNRVIRTVRKFNPGNAVVKEKLGDPVGWKALFTEFAPAKILPKKQAFKFETPD